MRSTVNTRRLRRRLVSLSLLLAAANAALAQTTSGDEEGVSGSASLGYLATSGNTDSTNANAAFELTWTLETWAHEFRARAVKARSNEVTTAQSYIAGYQGRRSFGDRSYFFVTADWEQDEFSAYDNRTSESVGYGRRFIDTERHELNAEVGAGARQLQRIDGTNEGDAIVRAALDYAWTINGTTSFSHELTIESGATNTSSVSLSELRARLFGMVNLVLSYRVRHNSDVLPGTEKIDRFTAISVEYGF
jgi:putative salt-induced outer membrane protein